MRHGTGHIARLVKAKIAQAESGEHQLAGYPDMIDSRRAIILKEGPLRVIIFAQHNVFHRCCAKNLVLLSLSGFLHPQVCCQRVHRDWGALKIDQAAIFQNTDPDNLTSPLR